MDRTSIWTTGRAQCEQNMAGDLCAHGFSLRLAQQRLDGVQLQPKEPCAVSNCMLCWVSGNLPELPELNPWTTAVELLDFRFVLLLVLHFSHSPDG